jgi:hypothetical protein
MAPAAPTRLMACGSRWRPGFVETPQNWVIRQTQFWGDRAAGKPVYQRASLNHGGASLASIVDPSTPQRVPTMLHREMLSHTGQALFVVSAQSPSFDHLKEDDKDGNAGEYSPHWVIPRPTIARGVNARKRPGLVERGPDAPLCREELARRVLPNLEVKTGTAANSMQCVCRFRRVVNRSLHYKPST